MGVFIRRQRATIFAVAVSILAWWWLHRWWLMAGDDYLFVTQGGDSYGRFSAQTWWHFLVDDWTVRNGRTADAALRLVLRPGPWFYQLIAPVLITGVGLALGRLLTAAHSPRNSAILAQGLLITPFIMWLIPQMAGDTALWAAGAINYIIPVGLAATGLSMALSCLQGRSTSWKAAIAASALLALADSFQEVLSVGLALAAVTLWLVYRTTLSAPAKLILTSMAAAFAIHMCAPGLWARSTLVASTTSGPVLQRLALATSQSFYVFWTRTSWLWFAVLAGLIWLALRRSSATTQRFWARLAVVGQLATTLLLAGFSSRSQLLHSPSASWALAVTITMGITWLLIWRVFMLHRTLLGVTTAVSWSLMVGSCVFVFASGVTGPRAHFVATLWLVMTILSGLQALLRNSNPDTLRYASIAVLTVMLLCAGMWWDRALIGLRLNHEFAMTQILAPLRQASPGEVITVPAEVPDPATVYSNAYLMPRYENALKTYYDLPSDVEIRNP